MTRRPAVPAPRAVGGDVKDLKSPVVCHRGPPSEFLEEVADFVDIATHSEAALTVAWTGL